MRTITTTTTVRDFREKAAFCMSHFLASLILILFPSFAGHGEHEHHHHHHAEGRSRAVPGKSS
jgi:hypothetical protein